MRLQESLFVKEVLDQFAMYQAVVLAWDRAAIPGDNSKYEIVEDAGVIDSMKKGKIITR